MKKLLLATTLLAGLAGSAWADSITLTATVDGGAPQVFTSSTGSLDVINQSFGSVFNLNTVTIDSQANLAAPGILNTNTLNVDQFTSGNHTLVLDISATGLTGPGALKILQSEFSVTGLTLGWSVQESTDINGVLLAQTPVFFGNSATASANDIALLTNPFEASARYVITTSGVGQFNGGVDINSVSAVPEPGTWGMMLLGFVGLAFAFRNRRRTIGATA